MANTFMTFDKFRTFETEFAGRPLVIETGKMAQLANGSCLVRYGDTVVQVAATASAKESSVVISTALASLSCSA